MAKPFTGYTRQEAKEIRQALSEQHLKTEADWPRILADITTLILDVCEGYTHPDTVLYAGDMKRRFAAFTTRLEAAVQAYDQLGERLQWHLEDCGFQLHYYNYRETAEAQQQQ
jgi:hypothetical protein